MKRNPLNIVFNHEQNQIFHNFELKNKALVIVLKFEPTFSKSYQMMFEGCIENNAEKQMVSHIFNDGGHRFWLQGLLNLLTRERNANYVAAILLYILKFLSV